MANALAYSAALLITVVKSFMGQVPGEWGSKMKRNMTLSDSFYRPLFFKTGPTIFSLLFNQHCFRKSGGETKTEGKGKGREVTHREKKRWLNK